MSNIVTLHCPLCGTKLKIKDASLFGKSVKCPGCKKSFVLHDPNAPSVQASAAAPEQPAPAKPPQPAFPDFSRLDEVDEDIPPMFAGAGGRTNPAPSTEPLFLAPGRSADTRNSASDAAPDWVAGPAPVSPEPGSSPLSLDVPLEASSGILAATRKARKKGRWVNVILGFVVLGVAVGGGIYLATKKPVPQNAVARTPSASATSSSNRPIDPNQPYSRALLESEPELVAEFKPTSGKPIELYMMPSGINLLFHLRPARFWSDDYEYKVLRASLTDDVVSWLKEQIRSLCLYDPEKIEELTVGVLLGARGVPAQYCCVVRLTQPEKLTTLIDLFPGKYLYEITERPNLRIKVDDTRGYLIHDEKTFAICPAGMAADLEYSIEVPNHDVSVGMSEMLERTDRDRLLTAIVDLRDLQIHLKALVPVMAQPFFQHLADWLGEDVEMASWSVHPAPYFYSEVALRPATTVEVAGLEAEMKSKLDTLPEMVWKEVCARMHPREMRFRTLIGRLPAMLQAFRESTISHREKRCVKLTTVLPAKATPNLALATMFTLDEATRTMFTTASVAVAAPAKPKLPDSVVDRLKIPVDTEFNRTPFEQAVTYLANEIQVNIVVDGDALKDAGYTRNMPQTFNLGKVPVQRAFLEITNAYQEKGKEMVISIDEATKTITVLTKKFAEAKGLPVYPLKAE